MPRLGLVIGQIGRIGGMEKQAALLSRELNMRGMDVTLFISDSKKKSRGTGSLDLGSIDRKHLFHSRYSHALSSRLLRYYCRRAHITHLMAYNVGNAELAVAAGIDARVAMNVRGTKFSTDSGLAERYRNAAGRCDCLITNSSNTSLLLQKSNIADESRIRVIHNGIELPEIEPAQRGKMVLYVGSIKEVKDPLTFVRACHDVIKIDGDVRVVMAGDGNMKPLIENYIGIREFLASGVELQQPARSALVRNSGRGYRQPGELRHHLGTGSPRTRPRIEQQEDGGGCPFPAGRWAGPEKSDFRAVQKYHQ